MFEERIDEITWNRNLSDGITRRKVLTGMASAGVALWAGKAAAALQSRVAAAGGSGLIDTHHHIAPQVWLDARAAHLAKVGLPQDDGTTALWKKWAPMDRIGLMDEARVGTAVLSLSTPGVWWGDNAAARQLSRQCNEYAAKMMADRPGRYGSFAVLPLPDVDGAIAEAEYSLDTLHATGVEVFSSYQGKNLGDPFFDPLWKELNRRKAVVFCHPLSPECCTNVVPKLTDSTLEYPFDTTRSIMSFLVNNFVSKFPDISFIFSHAGGAMPFLVERILRWPNDLAKTLASPAQPGSRLYDLRHFYYDTAVAANPITLPGLLKVVDISHAVFGSDFPWADDIRDRARDFNTCCQFTSKQLQTIGRDNAVRIMPQFGKQAG